MTSVERLQALRLADSMMSCGTVRVYVKYEKDRGKLEAENAKLRKLAGMTAKALGVGSGWCYSDCRREFECSHMDECPISASMRELGIEVE